MCVCFLYMCVQLYTPVGYGKTFAIYLQLFIYSFSKFKV